MSTPKNFLYQSGYQVLRILTPLLTTPYVARVLGAELVGEFYYTQAIAGYFVLVEALGMATYGVRLVASAADRSDRSHRFWGAWVSRLAVAVPVAALYLAMALTHMKYQLLWLCWLPYVVANALDASWLFFGCEDFALTTSRCAAVNLLCLAGIMTLVRSRADLPTYILIVATEPLLAQLSMWPSIGRHVDLVRIGWDDVRPHFLPSLRLFVPVVAASLYNSLNTVLVGQLSTMEQTGFYQYSYKVAVVPLAVVAALGTVMLPRMSSMLAEGRRDEALGLLRTSLWAMLAMSLALAWGVVGVADEFVPIFLGEEFVPCIPVVAVLAAIIPLSSVTNVFGLQYLVPLHRDNDYTISLCMGAAANAALGLALVPRMGAMGCAIGSVAAQGTVMLVQCHMVRGELPLGRYVLDAVPFCLVGAGMAAFLRQLVAPVLLGYFGVGAVTLVLEVVAGAVFYGVLCAVWFVATHNQQFYEILGLLRDAFRTSAGT